MKKTRLSPEKNLIGDRVRQARCKLTPKVSQEDLAGKLAAVGIQMTQASVSKIESRARYVMDYEIKALAKVLKVPISWLFDE